MSRGPAGEGNVNLYELMKDTRRTTKGHRAHRHGIPHVLYRLTGYTAI